MGADRPTNPRRELAAIMFSDVVGYTAIMGRDEQKGLDAIAQHRAHLRAVLPKFNGRLIGEIGDGTLSSFHSVVDALACARELQATLRNDPELRLRIGIHLGDVVFSDNTVLGDGVNVASRIHALAPPGGICISANAYDEIRNKPGMRAKDLGEKAMEQDRKVLEMDPNFDFAHFELGFMDIERGKPAEAIVELQKAGTLRTWSAAMGDLGYAYAASGRREEAEKLIDELSHRGYAPPDCIAYIYLGLDDKDRALEWLGKAYETARFS